MVVYTSSIAGSVNKKNHFQRQAGKKLKKNSNKNLNFFQHDGEREFFLSTIPAMLEVSTKKFHFHRHAGILDVDTSSMTLEL
jgi:hypothetical protein